MVTQVSCKLTNSLFYYLERQGVPTAPIFDAFDGPEEFLKDSHFWLEISQVEKIFERAAHAMGDASIGATVGAQIVDIQSWGALDNVFKLMPTVKDYYVNLTRFFSYFLAPIDEYKELEVGDTFVRITYPIPRLPNVHVFEFLKATLENLPRYTGNFPAHSDFSEATGEMLISWDTAQPSLFTEEPGQVLNPKLVKNLTNLLEANERALEQKKKELLDKQVELDRLKAELQNELREKIYAEKMAGLAQMAAGIAHEVNNPLSFVMSNLGRFEDYFHRLRNYLRELERQFSTGAPIDLKNLRQVRENLDIEFIFNETPVMFKEANDGLKRVKEIVKDLSSLAHPRQGRDEKKISTNIHEVIDTSLKVFGESLGDRIQVARNYQLQSPVRVFPIRMSQVFTNLLSNAIHSINNQGVIEVRTEQREKSAVIEIADTGAGMDEGVLSKLFTPFFTTKEVGQGTGLGLSIAQSIVEMHSGKIDVKSQKGRGSRFTITLPLEELN